MLCQRILDNLNTTVLVVDHDLKLRYVNPAGEVLFAVSARQLTDANLAELLSLNPGLTQAITTSLDNGHPFTEYGLKLDLPLDRAVVVDCTVTPLTEAGTTQAVIELAPVDRLLQLARDESLQDQQAANRAVMRGLAHEIKNPLGGLRGAAQLLERQLPDPALAEYTSIIIREADRLRNLVDRMVGPNQPPRYRGISIHEVLEHVRSLILAEITHGLNIERDYDPSLPEMVGDPEQLIQAVLNVVRNAAQAIDKQGTITLRTRAERKFAIGTRRHRLVLRVDVEDHGPGIPEALRDHIFYPMVTGRPDGTGLGLAIAQSIVCQHGGLIDFTSRPQLTVFRIYLPLETPHD